MNINYDNPVLAALLGVAVADALGVDSKRYDGQAG